MPYIPPEHPNKSAFLKKVREALGRTHPILHAPDHPPLKSNIARQREKVRTIVARNDARMLTNINRLMEKASFASWNVHRVESYEDAAATIARVARSHKVKNVIRSSEEIFKKVDVDKSLRSVGAPPTILASSRTRRRGQLKSIAFKSEMGVTGVGYAIAETASCAVIPRKGVARLTSLAPSVLILLVETEQILENLDDFFAITRLKRMESRSHGPNYYNFISGPSRTADIEQTLTVGVHGPGEVHMVIVG